MEKKSGSADKFADSEEYPGKELIHLENGTTHPMVSRFRTKAYWTYLCFPCGATCLGESFLLSHLQGKKHNIHILSKQIWPVHIVEKHPYFLRELNKPKENFPTQPLLENEKQTDLPTENVVIAPGEPVPPGVEEPVHINSMLEDALKSSDFPVVGLEYIIELLEEDSEPSYYCTLCGVQGLPRIIQRHIDGHRHKMKYMNVNYPKCYGLLRKYSGLDKYHPGNIQVLHNICQCIDQAYGRLPPLVVQKDDYERDKPKYLKMIFETKHFNERDGGNFEELVDEEYIIMVSQTHKNTFNDSDPRNKNSESSFESSDKLKSFDGQDSASNRNKKIQRSLRKKQSSVDSISSLSNVSDDELDNDCVIISTTQLDARNSSEIYPSHTEKRNQKSTFQKSSDNKYYSGRRSRSPLRNKSPHLRDQNYKSHTNLVSRSHQENSDRGKWNLFHKRFNKFVDNAKKTFEYNEQFPEKHPSYQTEWKKYWNKKYKEFQGDKKDIWQCDMKPEWITFWSKKMRELHDEEISKKKEELLESMGLPIEDSDELNPNKFIDKKKLQDPIFVEKELKMLRHRSLRSREKSKERDRSYDSKNQNVEIERNLRARSRDRNFERRRSLERGKERERNKRSRDRSWDRNERDYKRDKDGRSKYDKERDSKIRKFSPSRGDMHSSRNYSSSSRFISEQMSKVEKERKDIKWSIYHSKMRLFKDKLAKDLEKHQEDPKSHPLYHSEWLKFRSKNSIVDSDFDVNSEWNKFWKRKVKDLYDYELNQKMDDVLKDLGLNKESSIGAKQDRNYDKDKDRNLSNFYVQKLSVKDEEIGEDLNVVVVLRHLTALENYLGSLGPKVIDLLAAVLKMEKDKPNSSEDILSNDIYLVLLETVKEKLKGQLLADLIDSHVIQATKTAIQYTATLLHKASLKAEEEKKKQHLSLSVVGVGPVEKAAIANQIAEVLIAQGKTDVTTEELEKLINAVVGMANASQTSVNPTVPTTTSLLSQLMEIQNSSNIENDRKSSINGLQALQSAYNKNTQELSRSSQESSFSDKLSDSDLKTLFQNYKDLSSDEQHGLMTYIKKLEAKNPERVKNLQKVVKIDLSVNRQTINLDIRRSPSPFSKRLFGMNPVAEHKNKNTEKEPVKPFSFKSKDSDDDEDYSYEEVIKSAAEKAKEKQLQEELEIIKQSLKDSSNAIDEKVDLPKEVVPSEPLSVESSILLQNNQDLDIASLANVLQLVKNATNLKNSLNASQNTLPNQPFAAPPNQSQAIPNPQPPHKLPININAHQRESTISPSTQSSFSQRMPPPISQNVNAPLHIRDDIPRPGSQNQFQPSGQFQPPNQFQSANQFQSGNHFQPSNKFQNSNKFPPTNRFQSPSQFSGSNQSQSSNEMSNLIMPPSSGLGRMNQDSYNQNSKMDYLPMQNTNMGSHQFSNERFGNNYQKNMNMPSKFDNPNKTNYGNQIGSGNSFNKGSDFGNRYNSNDSGFHSKLPKMGWNNSQNDSNQYDSRSSSMNNQGPSMMNQGSSISNQGSSMGDYNQFNSPRGRGNQRNNFSNRGRGGGRPFPDNSYRRGGGGGGMNY